MRARARACMCMCFCVCACDPPLEGFGRVRCSFCPPSLPHSKPVCRLLSGGAKSGLFLVMHPCFRNKRSQTDGQDTYRDNPPASSCPLHNRSRFSLCAPCWIGAWACPTRNRNPTSRFSFSPFSLPILPNMSTLREILDEELARLPEAPADCVRVHKGRVVLAGRATTAQYSLLNVAVCAAQARLAAPAGARRLAVTCDLCLFLY